MRRIFQALFFSITIIASTPQKAHAQAAVNVASYALPNLPNGSLARGAMFAAYGTNLGPAAGASAPNTFPLPMSLSGTTVTVTVGGTTVECVLIHTIASRVTGILPSNTPAGEGTMRITYNGTQAASFPITVVDHSFGTFALNTAGSGPAVLTNANDPTRVNSILHSATAGEWWDIWGTGLGAAPFADNVQPTVQHLYDVQVVVGGKPAQVLYAGRSGCCAGVDQIRFVVPADVNGCYVPVHLVVGGVPSNFTTMSIGNTGGAPCSDPNGIPEGALTDGALTIGTISLSRVGIDLNLPSIPGVPTLPGTQLTETASASYVRYTPTQAVQQSLGGIVSTVGACTVYQYQGQDQDYSDPVVGVGLDAGASTSLNGPGGPKTLTKEEAGHYLALLSSPGLPFAAQKALIKGLALKTMHAASGEGVEQGSGQYFTPGTYTYQAPGGADVGGHTKAIDVGSPLTWTNKAQITSITRANGQTVTWTPFSGQTMILGGSFESLGEEENIAGAGFFCLANGNAGTFQIPAAVLQALPASETIDAGEFSIETGTLGVGMNKNETCQASGLDVCVLSFTDYTMKQVGYR